MEPSEVVDKVDKIIQTDRKRLSDEECSRGKMRIERGFMSSGFLAHETTVSKHMTEANDEVCERLSTV
ncbi:hypothetical protein P5F78_13460 [Shouchella clausii]|uniref:hypothetical protein n=1 Tax=Shouchella clausii TaxID=79880 RepID=UPI002E20163C|nr:hypothetical protein [Shouchella clausii]